MSKIKSIIYTFRSIKSMAKRDEGFNEFLGNFKSKNEQGWANIIDLSQEE